MNERSQLWVILEAVFVCVVFAALYAMGGSGDFWGGQKWLRRYLAPGIFCVWAFIRSGFDWRYFIQMGPMMGSLTLPYDILGPFIGRGLCGFATGAASSLTNALHGRWIVVSLGIILSITTSVVAGVFNPFPNAMVEQFVIGFIYIFIPAMTVGPRKKS